MIARWMLGAIAFSMLVGVAALAVDHGLRAMRRPTRLAWALAMVIAAVWPVVAWFVLVRPPHIASVGLGAALPVARTVGEPIPSPWLSTLTLDQFDVALQVGWVALSTLLSLQLVRALRILRRVRRESARVDVGNERVLIDDALGPAVIGLVAPSIVMPRWMLDMDEPLRALVVRHEHEHRRANDPALVWLAVVVTTLLPWNPALWWLAHRLRLAMEMDCDARTVQSVDDRTRYASLLLLIAQRKQSTRFVPALSDSRSPLARRISAMCDAPVGHPVMRAVIATSVASLAITAACSSRIAVNLTSPSPQVAATVSTPAAREATVAPDSVPPSSPSDQPATLLVTTDGAPRYPNALRAAKTTGSVLAMYVVGSDGMVDTLSLKVLRSTDAAFTAAVREALPRMRYSPARVSGSNVRQLVQQPFQFDLAQGERAVVQPAPSAVSPAPTRERERTIDPASVSDEKVYFDFQVEKPVTVRGGAAFPKYPEALRAERTEGRAMAQFIVDATGRVVVSSIKILKSDHPLFSDAVRAALADMQFGPATIGNRSVKQLVQQPFVFKLNDTP